MNIQYVSDSSGKPTGVFIPIKEWNLLKTKFKGIEEEDFGVPPWQVELVRDRLEDYKSNPESGVDFDTLINDLDKDL